jgi:hypothetical protein
MLTLLLFFYEPLDCGKSAPQAVGFVRPASFCIANTGLDGAVTTGRPGPAEHGTRL